MIASLRGAVGRVDEESVVIEVAGVGYQVFVHQRTAAQLRAAVGEVRLDVHTVVRDDAISLYGFLDPQELVFFRHLLGVERIGPKAALAILSRTEWGVLAEAIASEDHGVLAAVPGIGVKTARRIVLELKGTVDQMGIVSAPGRAPSSGAPVERAVEALVQLGFSAQQAREAVGAGLNTAQGEEPHTVEELVRDALQRLRPAEVRR
ncbi:MAG: Holliday junction branch migration protein RuvA [Candidatus Dormibacteraeota bacterium]|nr:Holliday junction branch migration protein RuvA [Candidatus Dormibacteraeota bacterium]